MYDSNLNYKGKFYINLQLRKNNYRQKLNGIEMFLKMKQKGEYYPYVPLFFIKKDFYINSKLSFYPRYSTSRLFINLECTFKCK